MLKRHLRSWLGIAKLEDSVDHCHRRVTDLRRDEHVSAMVVNALDEVLLGNKAPRESWKDRAPYTSQHFEATLRRVTSDEARAAAAAAIQDRICTEAFLDEVVERLQRKQLKA